MSRLNLNVDWMFSIIVYNEKVKATQPFKTLKLTLIVHLQSKYITLEAMMDLRIIESYTWPVHSRGLYEPFRLAQNAG